MAIDLTSSTIGGTEELSDYKAGYDRFRNRRFLMAVVFSIASKVASMGVQLLAIPIAISYCGMSTYVLYVQMVALSLGPCVFLLRLGPRFVGIVSILHSEGNYSQLAAVAKKGLLLTAFACVAVSLIAAAVPFVPRFEGFFRYRDVSIGFAILSFATLIGGLLQSVEAVQSGMHETHLISACYTISNVLCSLLLVTVIPIFANLLSLILVLHVIPLVSRSILAASFLFRHRNHFFSVAPQVERKNSVGLDALSYTLMSGFCSYLGFQAPMLALSSSSSELGVSQVLTLAFQFTLQALGLLGIVFVPMVPVMASAWNSSDFKLLARYRKSIILIVFGATFVGAAVGIVLGLLSLKDLNVTEGQLISIVASAGVFLSVLALEQFLTTYLLTTSSLNDSVWVYALTCVRSILVLGMAMIAIRLGLHLYAMFMMALVILLTACMPMQLMIYRRQRMKSLEIAPTNS